MADNRELWTELGIDLKQHDVLLGGLGPAYADIYLSQKDRPKGMGFFDFVVGDIHGIRVHELREHARNGGKVVATYCVFVPEEFAWAAGAIPVGLCAGAQFSVPLAEEVLPRNTCALIKSSFGFKLGRLCPYVQASHLIVGETTCDGKKKMFEILGRAPARLRHGGPEQEDEVRPRPVGGRSQRVQGRYREADRQQDHGSRICNERYEEGQRPPPRPAASLQPAQGQPGPHIGKDALLVTQVSFYDDVAAEHADGQRPLRRTRRTGRRRVTASSRKDAPRILISGSPMAIPNWKMHHLLESAGAAVVCEESCTGTRSFSDLVAENGGHRRGTGQRHRRPLHEDHTAPASRPTTSGRTISSGWPGSTRWTGSSITTCSSARPMPAKPARSKRPWPKRAFPSSGWRPTTRTRTPDN